MTALDLARISKAAYDRCPFVPAVKVVPKQTLAPNFFPTTPRAPTLPPHAFATAVSTPPTIATAMKVPTGAFCPVPQANGNWTLQRAWRNLVGFYCALYIKGDEQALSFRGTNDAWDVLVDDLQIAAGVPPLQTLPALLAADAAGLSEDAYLTGHSLGGALAVIAAAFTGRAAVTFNAPGVEDSCRVASPMALPKGVKAFLQTVSRCEQNERVWNIRIGGDLVSSQLLTGTQPGRTTSLEADQCGVDALCRHGIATVIAEMEKKPDYSEPLDL